MSGADMVRLQIWKLAIRRRESGAERGVRCMVTLAVLDDEESFGRFSR